MSFSLNHVVREAAPSDAPAPLLVLLHGVGSNEQDLMGLAPTLDRRFFIVSARAPLTLGHASYGWYHIDWSSGVPSMDPEEAEKSRNVLLRFIDELLQNYNIDPKRVYLMGFSQGCIMSIYCALTEPEKFAGIVGMSGRLVPGMRERTVSPDRLKDRPMIVVHGTEDTVIPIADGRALRDYLQSLPLDLTYREYSMGHWVTHESLNDITAWLEKRLE